MGLERVITGTARKNFRLDNLYLYPRAENVEIRSIESVNKDILRRLDLKELLYL